MTRWHSMIDPSPFANITIGPVSQDMCKITLGYMIGTIAVWKFVLALGGVIVIGGGIVAFITEWARAYFKRKYDKKVRK